MEDIKPLVKTLRIDYGSLVVVIEKTFDELSFKLIYTLTGYDHDGVMQWKELNKTREETLSSILNISKNEFNRWEG